MGGHDVLDEEVRHVHLGVTNLLDVLGVPLGGFIAIFFTLGACTYHSSRCEDQGSRARFTNTHDGCSESLRLVLDILTSSRDVTQVQVLAVQVRSRNDVLELRHVGLVKRLVEWGLDYWLRDNASALIVLHKLRCA